MVSKDPLWKLAMAFQGSKALLVAHRLDLFTRLLGKPSSAHDLARQLNLHPRPLGRLLNAMVACGLLRKQGNKFSNTAIARIYLVRGRPEYFGDYLSILNDVYESWKDFDTVIAENHSLPLFREEYADGTDTGRIIDRSPAHLVARVMRAQEAFSYGQAVALPKVYNFSKHRLMLDIGGGTGIFSVMAVKANPRLRSVVFDVPAVCAVARMRISSYKVTGQVRVIEGDFMRDCPPGGADVALISTVLDGYDEPACRMLLQKAFSVLEPGGTLIVNEMMLAEDRTGPLFPALFSLELMIERNTGDARTAGEIRQWMKDAGFVSLTAKPLRPPGETYLNCKIVTGRKPVR